MKNFKLLISIILFTFSINALSQSFYLFGGTNISTLSKVKEENYLQRTKQLGFQLGSIMDIKLSNKFLFSPQVSFTLKREKQNSESFMINGDVTNYNEIWSESQINDYYIDIPLAVKYNFSFKNVDIYPFIGPYVSLLLFNNSSSEMYIDGVIQESAIELEGKFINKLDYGLSTGLGLNYKSVLINFGIDLGLYREMKYEDFVINEKYKNTTFKISLGYKI